MIRRWLIRRHADPEREQADRDIAEQQLADAKYLKHEITDTADRFVERRQENGFGESYLQSMQPKWFLGRRLPWPH